MTYPNAAAAMSSAYPMGDTTDAGALCNAQMMKYCAAPPISPTPRT